MGIIIIIILSHQLKKQTNKQTTEQIAIQIFSTYECEYIFIFYTGPIVLYIR